MIQHCGSFINDTNSLVSLLESNAIVSVFVLACCSNFFTETGFPIEELTNNLKREVISNGPITRSVERLFWAAKKNDFYLTKELLTHNLESIAKVKIDSRDSPRIDVDLTDLYGITPLHVASVSC